MNCDETRQAIQAALDGAPLTGEAEGHLDGCAGCRAYRESLREADALLAADPVLPWTPEMTSAVLDRVAKERRARWWSGVAAAAVLLVAAWLGIGLVPVPDALGPVGTTVADRVALPATPVEAAQRFTGGLGALFDSVLASIQGLPFSAGVPMALIAVLTLLALNGIVAGRLRLAGRRS